MFKVHWLIKYYSVAFLVIFGTFIYIENTEPEVNWLLYDTNLEEKVNKAVLEKDCTVLLNEYEKELANNFEKGILGFYVRKDRNLKKGQNLNNYLNYHIKHNSCE